MLTRRHGFGIFWLASTLAPSAATGTIKSTIKRISRKEILGCDLVQACEHLINPEEPLALRLSSNLLCGIARVFQHQASHAHSLRSQSATHLSQLRAQQYTIYYSEVTHVHHSLKKAFSDAFVNQKPALTLLREVDLEDDQGVQVDQALQPVRRRQPNIDLPRDVQLDLDNDLVVNNIDWQDVVGLGQRRCDAHEKDADGVSLIESVDLREMTPDSPQLGRRHRFGSTGPHQASDLDAITLNEPHIQDYDPLIVREQTRRRQTAMSDNLGMMVQLEHQNEFAVDQGLFEFGQDEAGILEGHAPELDEAIRRATLSSSNFGRSRTGAAGRDRQSSSFFGGRAGGPGSSSIVGGVENPYENDLGGEALPLYDDNEPLRFDLLRGGVVQDAHQDQMQPHDEVMPLAGPVQEQLDQVVASPLPTPPPVKKPRKQLRAVAVDEEISLTDDQVREMRRGYVQRVQIERQAQLVTKANKKGVGEADVMVLGPPQQYGERDTKRSSNDLEDDDREAKRARAGQDEAHDVDLGDIQPLPDYDPNLNLEFGGGGDDYYNLHVFDEPELGRAAVGSVAEPTADSQAAAAAREQFPWHAEIVSSDVGGDVGGFYTAGAFGVSSQVGASRVSLDTPLRTQALRRSRTASLVPSALEVGSAREGSLGMLGDDQLEGFEEQQPLQLASPDAGKEQQDQLKSSLVRQQEAAQLELESLKFLSFISRKVPSDSPEEHVLSFSDVVPVSPSTTQVASAAFYHTLNLTSKRHLRVEQDEPYAEIRIEILRQAEVVG
ncbi:hypothetical protein ACM66B_004261 [Microbotryomycetes sp. NB124-2]